MYWWVLIIFKEELIKGFMYLGFTPIRPDLKTMPGYVLMGYEL